MPTDPEQIFEQAEKAEEQGDLQAAFQLLLKAALLGHTGAQLNLGNFYADGKGTATDRHTARLWYARAYAEGNVSGAFNLGIDYRNSGDLQNAIQWLGKAADQNDGEACVELAELVLGKPERLALLQRAIALSGAHISEDSRERATALLAELQSRHS